MRADEQLVVLRGPDTDAALVTAVLVAVERLGAVATVVTTSSGAPDTPAACASIAAADVVLWCAPNATPRDATPLTPEDTARVIVLGVDTLADLADVVPHPGLARRTERAVELLGAGAGAVIRSDAGTRLSIPLYAANLEAATATAAVAGAVARWPGGQAIVHLTPDAADGMEGTLVLMPGDLHTDLRAFVRSPVHLDIRRGRVVEISGDNVDADTLRAALEASGKASAYEVTTISIGMVARRDLRGLFDAVLLSPGDGALRGGVIEVTIGAPDDGGGARLGLRHTSLSVDGIDLLCDGTLEGSLSPDAYELAR